MKLIMIWMLALSFTACKTPADVEAEGEAVAPRETATQPAEPPLAAAVPTDQEAFTPVRLPGTPHDEEHTSVDLEWAAEGGEIALFTPAGVDWAPEGFVVLKTGDTIEYDDSVVVVLTPTKLTLTSDEAMLTSATRYDLETDQLAEASDPKVGSGDRVYMLKYAGEGTCYLQLNDEVYLANCPNDEFEPTTTKAERVEWWVEVGEGWLKVDDRVKVTTRSDL